MATVIERNDDLTSFVLEFEGIKPGLTQEFTIKEINLTESLLTPGLQTSIVIDNYRHHIPINEQGKPIYGGDKIPKNLEPFKNSIAKLRITKPSLANFKNSNDEPIKTDLDVIQRVYRLADRKNKTFAVEELILYCCDDSLLNDAKGLVNKSWVCATPTSIVEYVLNSCVGVGSLEAEDSAPARNFVAENIHPFQVVTQQAEVALASGDDPSFCHFMTYENFNKEPKGLHHFKSLKKMAQQKPIMKYIDSETSGTGSNRLGIPNLILHSEFPADFDLLLDILNGVGEEENSLVTINPVSKIVSLFGNKAMGCGVGGLNIKESSTNMAAPNLNGCSSNVEKYLLKRQARMRLLDNENISCRLTVPWNPELHVGKTIKVDLQNKEDETKRNYGTGKYLIAALTHNIKRGGMATTTLDCVSNTVKRGEL